MTEPVAYLVRNKRTEMDTLRHDKVNSDFYESTPLYTAEQLRPRVKMTQSEFDELNTISECASVHGAMNQVYSDNNTLMLLKKRFGGSNGQAELARLWFEYRSNNRTQQETIEIVPETKWFVRSKERVMGLYMFLSNLTTLRDPYCFTKKDNTSFAHRFDTKEEAEKWTNPLTEAVQLPVEDE